MVGNRRHSPPDFFGGKENTTLKCSFWFETSRMYWAVSRCGAVAIVTNLFNKINPSVYHASLCASTNPYIVLSVSYGTLPSHRRYYIGSFEAVAAIPKIDSNSLAIRRLLVFVAFSKLTILYTGVYIKPVAVMKGHIEQPKIRWKASRYKAFQENSLQPRYELSNFFPL